MSRFEIQTGIKQRGLGPPAWRRAIGLTVMAACAVLAIIAMLSLGGAQ